MCLCFVACLKLFFTGSGEPVPAEQSMRDRMVRVAPTLVDIGACLVQLAALVFPAVSAQTMGEDVNVMK